MHLDTHITLYVVAATLAAATFLAVMVRFSLARYIVLAMLFLACIGVPQDVFGVPYRTWLMPLQAQRSALYLAMGAALGLCWLIHLKRTSMLRVGGQAWCLLAIGLYMGLLGTIHDGIEEGAKVFAFALATILPLAFVVPAMLQRRSDWDRLIRIFVMLNILWVAAVIIQFAINPSMVVMGASRRFIGVIGNPQHAAVILAVCSVVVVWSLMHGAKRYWLLLASTLGVNLMLLAWTGSRTGAVMFVLGTTMVLYRRIGRTILLLPLAAVVLWTAYTIFGMLGVEVRTERFIAGGDTRTEAWSRMLEQGLENLWIGVGLAERVTSENSFLTGLAAYGIGAVVLILILLVVSVLHCWRLFRAGLAARQWRGHIDLLLAFNAMYFAGAMFEGYIISRVAFILVAMLVFAGMGGAILYLQQAEELHAAAEDHDAADHDTYDDVPVIEEDFDHRSEFA